MSQLSSEVARHLPFLRRYARAVVGDQQGGDACVRATLQRLLARPAILGTDDLRLVLYRSLHDGWTEGTESAVAAPSSMPADAGPIDADTILESRLGNLSALKRQALVLTTLEAFNLQEAARVMRLSVEEMAELLSLAKEDLRAQKATKILIIEDEPIIALDIATTVERNGHTVVGIATTHAEAVALARRDPPGLILADIQLQDDSSGIEAVQEILCSTSVPVIFVTAFPERLLTGERPEPAFLITKPFDPDTLNVSISQALAVVAADKP